MNEQDSTFLLENFMNTTTDVIYFKDLQSRFVKINEACAQKHGLSSPEDIVGKSDFDFWDEVHARQAFEDEQRIIRTGQPLDSFEEREVWPDGHITWVSSTKMPLRDNEGNIIGTFGMSRDITRRKEADLRLRQYSEELRSITDSMEDDVEMAGMLQKNFITDRYPVFQQEGNDSIKFLHRMEKSQPVTGDYCDFFRISDTEVGIFICDVCGTGIRAALGTALIRGIIQELRPETSAPGKFMSRMNELLHPLLRAEGESLGVTACYMSLDLKTGRMKLANAGHPMPIRFEQEFSAGWISENTEAIGPALAIQAEAVYAVVEVSIDPGDTVIAFTDGLYSLKNRMDDEYGLKRLLDSAHSWAGEPLDEVFDGLEEDALVFSATGKYEDDVCIIGFKLEHLMA